MRSVFSNLLARSMEKNKAIYLLAGDVGYGVLDEAWKTSSPRCFNMGASEQAMVGAAVGMAYSGCLPICYSITPFMLYRPFEWIRNYLDHDRAPVKMVAVGRDDDYKTLGFSHHAFEQKDVMRLFKNIRSFFPETHTELREMWPEFLSDGPAYLSLPR